MTEMSPLGSVSRPPARASDADEVHGVPGDPGPAAGLGRGPARSGRTAPSCRGTGSPSASSRCEGRGSPGRTTATRTRTSSTTGWLRTGDVGTLTPDGYLTLTDRSKDVIKSGGEWISSVELENTLMAHPDVVEASVVGVPDERWGERPLATVVVREGSDVDFDELRAFLAEHVARWQVPERWALIDAVPKTSVGKFDKKVLRQRYADGELDVTTLV